MTTLILSSVGGALGSVLGPFGAIAGSYLGASLGSYVDDKVFGLNKLSHLTSYRLDDLSIQTSTYGKTIPIVFGSMRISGNIIWAMPIREVISNNSTSQGKGLFRRSTSNIVYNYFVNVAIGICEGEIDSIEQIWADTVLLDKSRLNFRVYNGSENQNPDSLIQAVEGMENTPAYRGLAYIVIEDFQINDFGNRIPNFTFEVKRNLINEKSVEKRVLSVNMIPGSGEFAYDTTIQYKIPIQSFGDGSYNTAIKSRINNNTENSNQSDATAALDQLRQTFPFLKSISVVVGWFGDNLSAGQCNIYPAVESHDYTTSPDEWIVANLSRWKARIVTRNDQNNPIYGGTPSDKSLVNYLQELKKRGYEIILYPMLFMDLMDKPWRGRIVAENAANIEKFFGEDISKSSGNTFTYFEFVKHYAELTKDFVSGFIIGSELKGLTSFVDENKNYTAVDKLVKLAAVIKKILPEKVVTYAADWSEYHSVNGVFNLDKLWASDDIDVVGIDAYFPLTDIKSYSYQPSLEEIMNGWQSGEGYDYYYRDRTEKVLYDNQLYAWKDIQFWWQNFHPNESGGNTAWRPKMKKIWFTEYGFPSLHANTNMPNVFYNPESSESGLPVYSNGGINFDIQRIAIEATIEKWKDPEMVERMCLWCYDARPYPQFPIAKSVWADGNLWSYGHWVNGKLNRCLLSRILENLLSRVSDLSVDASQLPQSVDGFVITGDITVLDIMRLLSQIYFFDVSENQNGILFTQRGKRKKIKIPYGSLVSEKGVTQLAMTRLPKREIPQAISLSFISPLDNYEVRTVRIGDSHSPLTTLNLDLPIAMSADYANSAAQAILYSSQYQNGMYEFVLPISFAFLRAGDILELETQRDFSQQTVRTVKIVSIEYGRVLSIRSILEDETLYYFRQSASLLPTSEFMRNNKVSQTQLVYAVISPLKSETQKSIVLACCGVEDYWNGCVIFEGSRFKKLITMSEKSCFGRLLNGIKNKVKIGVPFENDSVTDTESELNIYLISGELESSEDLEYGDNLALLGSELLQFKTAELIGKNIYRLTDLSRGLFGTENFVSSHKTDEDFILLDDSIGRVFLKEEDVGKNKKLKIVSIGEDIEDGFDLEVFIE